MKYTLQGTIAAFAALTASQAVASNPLITDKWTADPAPLVDGEKIYLFTGHDEARDDEMFHMEDWLVFSSDNLKKWKDHGAIMRTDYVREGEKERKSVKIEWTKDPSAWAAQCVKSPHDGKYYFYFCAISKNDGMSVGVAVADKPTGPYKDALGKPLVRDADTPSPYWGNDIDPSVFVDDDGTPWMTWGNPVCYLAKLKKNMIELDGEIRVIPLPNYTEGPWLDKRGDTYYLIYPSRAHQGFGEHLDYASAWDINGPWIYRGRLTGGAEASYTIHPGLAKFKGRDVMFYHAGLLSMNGLGPGTGRRAVCAEWVEISPNGPIKPFEQTKEGLDKEPPKQGSYTAKFEDVPFVGTRAGGFNFDEYGLSAYPQPTAKGRAEGRGIDSFLRWDEGAAYKSVENPFKDSPQCDGFNMVEGKRVTGNGEREIAIAEDFVLEADMRLAKINLYLTDGEGGTVKIALADEENDIFEVPVNYVPQGYGIASLTIAKWQQPLLKAGKKYTLELRGEKGSAVCYWRRGFNGEKPHGFALYGRNTVNGITTDGTNPLFKDVYAADPAPFVDGDTMYVYAGHDQAVPGQWLNMTEWLCWSTKDGVHYKSEGAVMKPEDFKWARGEAWAVQVVKRHGKYWLYATCTQDDGKGGWGGRAIGVAVADRPTGPFKDALGYPMISENKMDPRTVLATGGSIDPSVFIDDDDKAYIVWGNPRCQFAKLKDNMVELDGDFVTLDLDEYGEGPWLEKHNGLYYLYYVTDIHKGTVPEKHAYATAKDINGPWQCHGLYMEAARQSFGIHPGIAHFKGKHYSFYHNGMLEFPDGRKGSAERRAVCVETFEFNEDGTVPFIKETDEGVFNNEVAASEVAEEEDVLDLLDLEGVAGESSSAADSDVAVITMYPTKTHKIPETLYGLFFEDINHAADGGIYPELISNRGFDARKDFGAIDGWETICLDPKTKTLDPQGKLPLSATRASIQCGAPLHPNTAQHLRVETFGSGLGGVRNDGYDGVSVKKGESYDLSLYVRALDGYKGNVRIILADKACSNIVASVTLKNSSLSIGPKKSSLDFKLPKWRRHTAVIKPKATVRDGALFVLLDKPGAVEFEMVSLFPKATYGGRKNGLRKDLVELLKAIKPGVIRFPGGCIIEGHDFQHWYDWKRTVGPLERREAIWNTWGYWQTMGLGYFEYFCLAEDIGAEPLPIMLGGMTCQFREEKLAPMDAMPYFAQNIIDLIDFANADPADNEWAKLRADMGHPEPFNLKFVGIGNENWDDEFLKRYDAIYKIVHEAHPEIKIVSSAGAGPGPGGVYEKAWKHLSNPKSADLIDEHFYVPPEWMLQQTKRYDDFDREGPHVFAGEYACHVPGGSNNLYSALCEAAMMTGYERNSDVVDMATYAPLFNKEGWGGWKPDLIWFDNFTSYGTPNYHVQKLFGVNRPTDYIASDCSARILPQKRRISGRVGFKTWSTSVEVKNISVVDKKGEALFSGELDPYECDKEAGGKWSEKNGVISQSRANKTDTAIYFGEKGWSDYTFSCDFRRTGGHEGIVLFVRDGNGKRISVNIGGWGNTATGIELAGYEGVKAPANVPTRLEDNRWYHAEVVADGSYITVTLDGRKLFDRVKLRMPDLPDFFENTGYDESTGEYVVKLVNVADVPRKVRIEFGTNVPAGTIKRTVLTGDPEVVNTIDNPNNCAPTEDSFTFNGGNALETVVPESSLTILRFKK